MAISQLRYKFFVIKLLFISCLLLLFIGVSGCSPKDTQPDAEQILASVGSYEITQTHFLNELQRFNARAGYGMNLSPDVMEAVLNQRLNRYVIVEYAMAQEWHNEPDVNHMREMIERKAVMEEFERRFILDRLTIDDNDLRELFYRANTSVRASHLFARNRREADSLFALLQQGHDFSELAASVFQNPELARTGGDLGFFTLDDMDISFEDQAFRMEIGEVSGPVQTSRGFSIIKVTDIVTTPVITETQFANRRNEIAAIARDQKSELAVRNHLRNTIDTFEYDPDLMQRLWEDVRNDPDAYLEFNPELSRLEVRLSPDVAGQTLVTHGDFVFTADDFLREGFFTTFSQRREARNVHDFTAQVKAMAYRAMAMEQARTHPDYNARYVQRTADETFYNYLNQMFDEYLETLVQVTEADIREEYRRNTGLYVEPLQLDMAEIVVTSEAAADQVWEALQSGRNFEDVLRQYTADPAARENMGRLGFIPINQFGMMAPSLVSIQPGEYAGPFQITGARFHIFKCLGRIEPRQLSFEEAIPLVERALRAEAKDQLKIQIIGEAREQFNATVYTDRLLSIPIQL
ncbi:MAG: peptidylprolyl isomerase [Candidatus Cyclonatronum sp.]|uniref:peptidylprolyl isomerase n=1 Tax=Cyclonatronum sp. TaxID=3024185 RepID=UPI0025C28805|nr:peptidylprolyl isomerase [Cyclonatronum sp.]MCH8485596.1 peptidylprolyl isomerase [Cyclonatronum sp.]